MTAAHACAQVWTSPGQWSFPINLPVQAFGVFPAGTLQNGQTYPWTEDLDFRIFKGRVAKGALHCTFLPGHDVAVAHEMAVLCYHDM